MIPVVTPTGPASRVMSNMCVQKPKKKSLLISSKEYFLKYKILVIIYNIYVYDNPQVLKFPSSNKDGSKYMEDIHGKNEIK